MRQGIIGFLGTIEWIALALLAAVFSFLGVATVSSFPPAFCSAGLIAFGAVAAFGLRHSVVKRDGKTLGAAGAMAVSLVMFLGLSSAWPVELPPDLPRAASPTPSSQGFFTLSDGSRLFYRHYAARGPNADTLAPIVILHGGPGVSPPKGSFDLYGRLARSGHSVYFYQQIGVGQSSRLSDITHYTLQRSIDDLEKLRETIGAPRIILIGQSWGAVLASYYIAKHPDAVERAVFISPGAFHHQDLFHSNYRRTALADNVVGTLLPLKLRLAELLARLNPRSAQALLDQTELGRAYDAFWADPASIDGLICTGSRVDPTAFERETGANFYALLMNSASLSRAPDPSPELAKFRAPVLILHGDCDFVPRAVAEDYAAILAEARIVDIRGVGHLILEAKPNDVLALILNFLDDPTPISR